MSGTTVQIYNNMTLGDATEVRAMLGKFTQLIDDAEITNAIAFGDSEVIRRTGVSEANPSTIAASNLFAVSLIARKYPDLANIASTDFRDAANICMSISTSESDTDPDSGVPLFESAEYDTYPLNVDVKYEKQTKTRGARGPSFDDVVANYESGYWMI